jgi:beta-phosphoglucomutase
MLSLERGLPVALHGFLNDLKQQYTMELVHARCKPVFQHEFALSNLRSRGYRLAVASNSVRRTVDVMLERANLAPYLSAAISNEDVTTGKPDPEIYRLAMERLAVAPERTLVIEDNEHGIQAATASGAHVLVVRDPLDVTFDRISDRIAELESVPA